MKKTFVFALALAALLLTAVHVPAGEPDPVRIAIIFPMSGANADSGKQNADGCALAVKHINDAGGIKSLGGAKLELVIADIMSDTNQCKAVAERVMQDKSILAVTGASSSAFVLPMLQVFEKARTPFITAQVAPAITGQGYQYVFETTAIAPENAKAQIGFLQYIIKKYDLDLKKVGVVYENTEYGQSNASSAAKMVEEAGLEVVFNESFPIGIPDASALIVSLKNSGAQVMIPSCYAQDAKTLTTAMRSLNYSPVIIGGGAGFLLPAFAAELGDGVEGIISSASGNWDSRNIQENPRFKMVPEDFKKTYGEFMTEQSVASYNIIWMLSQALEKTGSRDKTQLRDAIRALQIDTFTVGGPQKFNENGYNTNALALMVQWQKQEDGSFIPRTVYPEEYTTTEYILPEMLRK